MRVLDAIEKGVLFGQRRVFSIVEDAHSPFDLLLCIHHTEYGNF